jgi:hypothetical protein
MLSSFIDRIIDKIENRNEISLPRFKTLNFGSLFHCSFISQRRRDLNPRSSSLELALELPTLLALPSEL